MSGPGGTRGATQERLVLADRVRAMRNEERLIYQEIADRLGISRSYAQQLYADPDGSLERERKDGYSGVCVDCGAPTSGSNGRARAPERCYLCSNHDRKVWTRERIIDAIRRFAVIHDRPPTADEWITHDADNGYPARSSVYRSSPTSSAPFAFWADAIEAAGYPRPTTGRRTWRNNMPRADRNGYVVLQELDEGSWKVGDIRNETSQVLALNAALNGHAPEGRWIAVPVRYWRPRGLKPRTIFDFVEDA